MCFSAGRDGPITLRIYKKTSTISTQKEVWIKSLQGGIGKALTLVTKGMKTMSAVDF
jgi:hypothetical protein